MLSMVFISFRCPVMVLSNIRTTSYFPIKHGAIYGSFAQIKYEHLGYMKHCVIKAKCQGIEHVASGDDVAISKGEIFYIDTLNQRILNEDGEILAASSIVRRRS